MVLAPLTDTTMWHILTCKSTPHCEPNSKSSPKPELFEERGLIFIIICNSQSLTGTSDIYTINKQQLLPVRKTLNPIRCDPLNIVEALQPKELDAMNRSHLFEKLAILNIDLI